MDLQNNSKSILPPSTNWVSLNVGGKIFCTCKETLCSDKDSMLAKMFSENYGFQAARKDAANNYLIDRDPKYFSYILNFLRTGTVHITPDISVEALLEEATYFQINSLVNYLKNLPELTRQQIILYHKTIKTFEGLRLYGVDFSNLSFRGEQFDGAQLVGAQFDNAKLDNASFTKVQAPGVSFAGISGIAAVFRDANLQDTDFHNSNLAEANFSASNLRNSNFQNTNCEKALFQKAILTNANFRQANLSNAKVQEADFRNVDFTSALLKDCHFTNCDLRNCQINWVC